VYIMSSRASSLSPFVITQVKTMTNFTKYFGIPGSGKTETLLTNIEKLVDEDIGIYDISYVTFSKPAAEDAINRMKDRLIGEDKEPYFFGTIHAICKRLLAWDFGTEEEGYLRLESPFDRFKYLQGYDLTYPIINNNSQEIPENVFSDYDLINKTDEEKIFAVINWCNHRCVSLHNWRSSGISFEYLDPNRVLDICKGWLEHKQENNLVAFDDMLLETLKEKLHPATHILFVDEFQDLSPLLYRVFMLWSKQMDSVIVGGDDDQTIFSWAGASPDFLLNLKADVKVLNKSYRVPSNILMRAKNLIETVDVRQPKEYQAVKQGGQFIYLNCPSFDDIVKHIPIGKTVYFLFRTNHLALKFCKSYLIPLGIPFSGLRKKTPLPNIWTRKLEEIRDAFLKINQGRPLRNWEVSRLLDLLPSCSKGKLDGYVRYGIKSWFKKEGHEQKKEWSIVDLLNRLFVKFPEWNSRTILSSIGNDYQVKAYLSNIQNKYYNLRAYNIKVGTLHSAKGLEANTVFVFNNHTSKTEAEMLDKGQVVIDEEKRLYYVGMTRAMETLVVVDNFFDTYSFDLGVSN